ncbi:MAG: cytochrome c biogenesis protein ResB, partial [Thermodesulfobacteriota bacterium]
MARPKTFIDDLVDFLASVRLALVILISLALTAIAGTIIPQNLEPAQYIQGYGPRLYSFLYRLGLLDMYHSWWFYLLLALLVLNLIVCSARRLPMSLKLARSAGADRIGPDFLHRQPLSRSWRLPGSPEENLARLRNVLAGRFVRPREARSAWGVLLYADRGAFSRFGAYVVHFSLLLIVAGSIVGGLAGFSAGLVLNEGETGHVVEGVRPRGDITLPFSVRLDKFTVRYYDTGAPSEYRSDLTVIEDGREVARASVRVNHPLTWRGVTFYQSTYGRNFDGPITLRLNRRSNEEPLLLEVRPGMSSRLPDGSAMIAVVDFHENLRGAGPAAQVVVRPTDGEPYAAWAFRNRPAGFKTPPGQTLDLELADFKLSYYTGLQVNKDPGVWLIWTGCGLMMAGFFITFFFSPQRLYLGLVPKGAFTEVLLAGSSHRHKGAFRVKFEGLAAALDR